MAKLIVNPGRPHERVLLLRSGTTTIGRTEDNDLCLPHKSLSRHHAKIVEQPAGTFWLEDLGSKNGTFIDGAPIQRQALVGARYIACGDVVLSFVPGVAVPGAAEPALADEALSEGEGSASEQPMEAQPGGGAGAGLAADGLTRLLGAGAPSILNLPASDPAERTARKLEILLQISGLLSSPASLDEVLLKLLGLVFHVMDVDRAALLWLDDDDRIRLRVGRFRDGRGMQAGSYSESIVRQALTAGRAGLVVDPAADASQPASPSIRRQSIRGAMCVPMRSRDGTAGGALYVDSLRRGAQYTQEDLKFLGAFAVQGGLAIDNAELAAQLAEEALQRHTLERFFPPTTVETLLRSGGGSLQPVETEATALFCDISGYTALSGGLPPATVIGLLNAYFPVVSEAVFQHHGTLEKYIGDALLAVWGAPVRRPDDARLAVAAAIEMQRAVAKHEPSWRKQVLGGHSQPIKVHIGINSGPVVAGNIGSSRYLQYATIGDTTNVASRICGAAGPGEVLIDHQTFVRLGDAPWPCEALPPLQLRGKELPTQLYRVAWD